MARFWACTITLLFTLAACGGLESGGSTGQAAWGGVVDTLPSGALAIRNPPGGEITDLQIRARVGHVEGPTPYELGRVQFLSVDQLERLYVVDSQARVIRVFDRDGVFVRDLGGPGQGPGEFEEPTGLTWRDESTLWVFDVGNGRYSAYDTSGAYLSDIRRPALGVQWPWPGRFDADQLIEPVIQFGGSPLAGFRVTAQGNAMEPGDTFPDPVSGVIPQARSPFFVLRRGPTVRLLPVPFAEGYQWVLDGQGSLWVGNGMEYRIIRRTLDGDTTLIVHRPGTEAPVTEAERDAAIAALGEPEATRDLDVSKIPSTKPAFRRLIPGPRGTLWVLREGVENEWYFDVFDSYGHLQDVFRSSVIPELRVPPVVGNGGSIWMVTRDEWDVQTVVRLGVEGS